MRGGEHVAGVDRLPEVDDAAVARHVRHRAFGAGCFCYRAATKDPRNRRTRGSEQGLRQA